MKKPQEIPVSRIKLPPEFHALLRQLAVKRQQPLNRVVASALLAMAEAEGILNKKAAK